MTKARPCNSRKSDGTPCQAPAVAGCDRCFFHDPGLSAARAEASKAGGKTRAKALAVIEQVSLAVNTPDTELRSAKDVTSLLSATIDQVRRGQVAPKVGSTVGYLASILLKALEQRLLEEQVNILEQVVQGQSHRRSTAFDLPLFEEEPTLELTTETGGKDDG